MSDILNRPSIEHDIMDAVSNRIRERLEKEIRPIVMDMASNIFAEEVAKVSVEISEFMTFERIGQTLRIEIVKRDAKEKKP